VAAYALTVGRDSRNKLSEVLCHSGWTNREIRRRVTHYASGPRRVCDVTDLYCGGCDFKNASFAKFVPWSAQIAERVMRIRRGKRYRGWEAVWAGFASPR